jgi:phosphoglycolate phosphatase-like HAD superfamily hydrolase
LNYTISLEYKRPDPIILDAIFAVNKAIGRLANDTVKDKVLFVGDTYNDMVFGNLAGIKTAKVTPFKPFSEPLDMVLSRVTDVSLGQLRKLAN